MTLFFTLLKRSLGTVLLLLFLSACKTTKVVTDGNVNSGLTAKAIIKQHYLNQLDF